MAEPAARFMLFAPDLTLLAKATTPPDALSNTMLEIKGVPPPTDGLKLPEFILFSSVFCVVGSRYVKTLKLPEIMLLSLRLSICAASAMAACA